MSADSTGPYFLESCSHLIELGWCFSRMTATLTTQYTTLHYTHQYASQLECQAGLLIVNPDSGETPYSTPLALQRQASVFCVTCDMNLWTFRDDDWDHSVRHAKKKLFWIGSRPVNACSATEADGFLAAKRFSGLVPVSSNKLQRYRNRCMSPVWTINYETKLAGGIRRISYSCGVL